MENVSVIVIIFGSVFGIALIISWIILPFAVFGIKKRLDRIIAIMQKA